MKIYCYIRTSTAAQDYNNQRFEILKFADEKKLIVDEWIEETQSGTVKANQRDLGKLISRMKKNEILLITELSRLGRSLLDVMSTLNILMEKECFLYSVKEKFELGDNINSKVLAFAFSLSAEVERSMISSRTKEALQRKKANGQSLGRPIGYQLKNTKLTGKEEEIKNLLKHKVSARAMARMYGVHPVTIREFILKCKLI